MLDIEERLEQAAKNDEFFNSRQLKLDARAEIRRLRFELKTVREEWDIASRAESRCHELQDEIERLRSNTEQLRSDTMHDQSLIADLIFEKKILEAEIEQLRKELSQCA